MRKLLVGLIILVLGVQSVQAALTFASGTGDRVEIAAAASINNLTSITVIAWVNASSIATAKRIAAKDSGGNGWLFDLTGVAGFLNFDWTRSTLKDSTVTSSLAITAGAWYFLAATADQVAAPKVYVGDLTTAAAEPTYLTSQFGSGTYTDDSATVLDIGNHSNNNQGFPGAIAWTGIWNRVLTLAEIESQRIHPHITPGNVVFMTLGTNGVGTQYDWTANHNDGTVTTATASADPAISIGCRVSILGAGC